MKRLLTVLLVFASFAAIARQKGFTLLARDSIGRELDEDCRFHSGDDPAMARAGYDDSQWPLVNPEFRYHSGSNKNVSDTFSSIGWFRFHFLADSTAAGMNIALGISHYGASEVFFDGKKIDSFGTIAGPEGSAYYDPQYLPLVLTIPNAGEHVLAIRYANYAARSNERFFKLSFSGIRIYMNEANKAIRTSHSIIAAIVTIYIFFFGIFFGIFIVQLLLYMYRRTLRSNLFFSLFCISLSYTFLSLYLGRILTYPRAVAIVNLLGLLNTAAVCVFFSGFINELFSERKRRFKIITLLAAVPLVLAYINSMAGAIAFFSLIAIVSIEAIVLTIMAIVKKKKGARIIGTGILLFCFFIVINGGLSFSPGALSFHSIPAAIVYGIVSLLAILSIPVAMSIYLSWSYASINKNLERNLARVKILSEKTLEQEQEKQRLLEHQNELLEQEVATRTEEINRKHTELKIEKKKTDDLLLNILPSEVADELKDSGSSAARHFDDVTVIFTDFVDFTRAGEKMEPQELVNELDTCFKAFDEITTRYDIEKIKTIGDAYLAVAGLPVADPQHARHVVQAATEIRDFMEKRYAQLGSKTFRVRIGVHSGSVVAGIVGVKKFAYDIWGDTVNTAARMEQNSQPGRINISQTTYDRVKDNFTCEYRGEIDAKNKGMLRMYYVV